MATLFSVGKTASVAAGRRSTPCIFFALQQQQQQPPQRQARRRWLSSSSSTLFPDYGSQTFSHNHHKNGDRENKKTKKRGKPSYRFVDKIRVRASAGEGGKGSVSMYTITRKRKLKPDGGHGGDGGSVIIFADPNEQSLRMSRPHIQADKGGNGSSQNCFGRKGKNTIVRVPCGVVVKRILDYHEEWDPETQEVIDTREEPNRDNNNHRNDYDEEEEDDDGYYFSYGNEEPAYINDNHHKTPKKSPPQPDEDMIGFSDWDAFEGDYGEDFDDEDGLSYDDREKVVLADLEKPGDHVVVARGGKGGLGSGLFASLHGKLPEAKIMQRNARPEPGEVAFLELELKLIADIGLVGFPNAGKISKIMFLEPIFDRAIFHCVKGTLLNP